MNIIYLSVTFKLLEEASTKEDVTIGKKQKA